MNQETNENQLYRAWRDGEQTAGEALFRRHRVAIIRFFRRQVSEAHDVHDLVQQTFQAGFDPAAAFRGEGSFKSYLFGIARNKLFAYFRKRSRTPLGFDPSRIRAAEITTDPDYVLEQRESQRLLMKSLRRIPLDCQIALELFNWEKMTGPQIAEVLGIPLGTVRSRLRRGIELLRSKYQELAESSLALEATTMTVDSWRRSLRAHTEIHHQPSEHEDRGQRSSTHASST